MQKQVNCMNALEDIHTFGHHEEGVEEAGEEEEKVERYRVENTSPEMEVSAAFGHRFRGEHECTYQ